MVVKRKWTKVRVCVVVLALLGLVFLEAGLADTVRCQFGSCVNTASGVTIPVITPIVESFETCTVDGSSASQLLDDGAIVRATKYVWAGASSSVTGQCNKFGWHPYPTVCESKGTELRLLQFINVRRLLPSGTQLPISAYEMYNQDANHNTIYLQSMDSSVANSTTGPFIFSLDDVGVHQFRVKDVTTATACNIQPTVHAEQTRSVGAAVCKPDWNRVLGKTPHVPDAPITLAIPADSSWDRMADAADIARFAWLGLPTITVGRGTCGVDFVSDGSCVDFVEDVATVCTEMFRGTMDASGMMITPATISNVPSWRDRTDARLQYAIAHEIGHLFGLANSDHSTCNRQNSIMKAGYVGCNGSPNAGDAVTGQPGDLMAAKDTYNKANRKICGW